MENQEINNTAVQETEQKPVETIEIKFSRKLARPFTSSGGKDMVAVYNAGKKKISYEVREFIPQTAYGNTSIVYGYTTPSGWTRSADGKYFSKKVTLNDNATFVDVIKNNVEYGDISINKAIPVDDTFDRTKVTFYLYNTDKNVLIASGKVDSKGNIEWTKVAPSGYGVDDCKVGINEIKDLPLGNYRIEEVWNRAYLESLDGKKVEIISTNNSGWTLDQKADTTRYYKNFVLKDDGKVFAFGSIKNDEHVQWFNMTKTVTVAGDVSTIKADLFYVTDNKELIKVAEGSCTTSKGKGTYNFTWEYNGVSEMRNGLQTLKLPEGDYIVREYVPKTFYANGKSNVPYTYMVPEGFTAVKDKSGKIVSFEKNFHASNNETAVISQSITNTRIEASLEIRKVEQAATIDRDFRFAIYYRGNEEKAQNIGVFTDKYLLDTVTVRTSKGSGMTKLNKIPEGWYEIVEIQSAGWAASWVNSDSNTADGKLVSYADHKRKKKKSLTLKQEINFLKFVREDGRYWHLYPTFFILLNTGLRAGEFTGLRWKDVDLENGIIDVNHTLVYFNHRDETGYRYSISTPKTENGKRKVIMTQAVIDAFHLERKFQEFLGLKSVDVIDGYSDFIFISKHNHIQNYNKLNKVIVNIINDYNKWIRSKGITDTNELLPHFSCHILRHTYATRLLEAGAAIKFISAQMGHSDIQITYDTYIDVTDEFKRVQIKPFEKYMDSAMGESDSEPVDLNGYIS